MAPRPRSPLPPRRASATMIPIQRSPRIAPRNGKDGPAMIGISKMASAVQPSATLAAAAKARQLKAEGVAVFDFSLGEPDFPTPEHIRAAAVKAMHAGHTHYTPANGTP